MTKCLYLLKYELYLFEHICFGCLFDAALKDLRNLVPTFKPTINMWSYEVWIELDAQIVSFWGRMARVLPVTLNVDFALVDGRERNTNARIIR